MVVLSSAIFTYIHKLERQVEMEGGRGGGGEDEKRKKRKAVVSMVSISLFPTAPFLFPTLHPSNNNKECRLKSRNPIHL